MKLRREGVKFRKIPGAQYRKQILTWPKFAMQKVVTGLVTSNQSAIFHHSIVMQAKIIDNIGLFLFSYFEQSTANPSSV